MPTVLLLHCTILLFRILSGSTINVHSSCNSLIDGLHYIKPLQNNEVIPVMCSNQYTLIDPSLNFDSITSYLSSYDYSRRSSNIFSSELDDFVNWKEWWLPSNDKTLFTVSPGCNECNTDNNNAYYMSNYYFCFKTLPNNECDPNDASLNIYCSICDDTEHDPILWSNCYGIQLSADHQIDTDHSKCVSQTIMARPSMVKDRSFCTCYKPINDDEYTVNTDDLPIVYLSQELRNTLPFIDDNIILKDIINDDDNNDDEDSIYYLTNNDFLYGTYRITKSGEYILSEDILIDFNGAKQDEMDDINWSPNNYDIDDLYWWPSRQQIEDGMYKGMDDFHGLYTLGFFAAITIETNDVIINLNSFSISMSKQFYLQQRFFCIIQVSDRNFIAAQGPANLGVDEAFYASNVVIKDGTIGLTSHHGIHGNNAQHIVIKNVVIHSFDVAGIAFNGANNIQIMDTTIGPQNNDIPVLGRYTHARAILPRLKQFVQDFGDQTIQFYDRNAVKISELADRLVKQMDLVYFYVMNDVISMDDEWQNAQKLFINTNGWMDAGSSYGIVLNGEGASTLSIGARVDNTMDITLNNVEIMGIYNGAIEKVKSVTINDDNGALRGILSDPIDWQAVIDYEHNKYIGDAYTDVIFAMNKIQKETEWYYLHCMRITDDIESFVFDGDYAKFSLNIDILCNTDIQMHSNKGAIGLRIDGVQNIELNNIYIHDIINYGALGSDICGEYEISRISKEDPDIEYGYTGNYARGLVVDYAWGVFEDIVIDNVDSHYGSSWAIVIYKESDIKMKGKVRLNNVYGGSEMRMSDVEALKLPNVTPKACSIEVRLDANVVYVEDDIVGNSIIGYDLCDDDVQIGQCNDCVIKGNVNAPAKTLSIWLMAIFVVTVSCLIGCYIVLHSDNRVLKYLHNSEETLPLLT